MKWLWFGCMLVVLAGCQKTTASVDPVKTLEQGIKQRSTDTKMKTIAVIDGRKLGLDDFLAFWKTHGHLNKKDAFDAFIEQETIVKPALNTESEPEALNFARTRGLAGVWADTQINKHVGQTSIKPEILEQYKMGLAKQMAQPGGYKVFHLLVSVPKTKYDPTTRRRLKWTDEQRAVLFERAKVMAQSFGKLLPAKPTIAQLEAFRINHYEAARQQDLDLFVQTDLKFPEPGSLSQAALPKTWTRIEGTFAQTSINVFKQKGVGYLSQPTKSIFGYHLIVVQEKIKAIKADITTLDGAAQRMALKVARQQYLQGQYARLLKSYAWHVYPDVLNGPKF